MLCVLIYLLSFTSVIAKVNDLVINTIPKHSIADIIDETESLRLNNELIGTIDLSGYQVKMDDEKELIVIPINTSQNVDWSALGAGFVGSSCRAITIDKKGTVYAGGDFIVRTSDGDVHNIAKWENGKWSRLGGYIFGVVNSIAIDDNNNRIFIAGGGQNYNSHRSWSYIAFLQNGKWHDLGSGLDSWCNVVVIDNHGDVYAGGEFTHAGGIPVNHIAKWENGKWSSLGDGLDNYCLSIAIDSKGTVYSGGLFTNAGGKLANYIAKWENGKWSNLGTGLNGWVYTIATDHNDNVYAGGYFTQAGGIQASHIAKWKNDNWSRLGEGLNHNCFALFIDSYNNIYAGGEFTHAGGKPANYIAKWENKKWSSLGFGLNKKCWTLSNNHNGSIYVGGLFTNAGGKSANRIAKYYLPDPSTMIRLDQMYIGVQDHEIISNTVLTVEGTVSISSSNPAKPQKMNKKYIDDGFLLWVEEGIVTDDLIIASPSYWADHVFYDNYDMVPLDSVKAFIEINRHLPGIPSEKEILQNGYRSHDMTVKMLIKIEELTKYQIDIDNQTKSLFEHKKELIKELIKLNSTLNHKK